MARSRGYTASSSGIIKLLVLFVLGVVAAAAWRYEIKPPAVKPDPGWLPAQKSDRWECIVIHHSGSDQGGAQRFDEWHRQRGWDELGYHFVIGNGTDTAVGQIEVGPRWLEQKHGAHTKTPDSYYNQHGIGICLVGNFDKGPPSEQQMQALARLVKFLSREFRIPPSHIYTHGGVTHKTDCPGKYFDVEKLKRMISR